MKAQIIIQLDDDGKLGVATSVKNPYLTLGLLEAAKVVIIEQGKPQSAIEIPKFIPPGL